MSNEPVTVGRMEVSARFHYCESELRGSSLHLRFVVDEQPLGFGDQALCGTTVGWDRPEAVDPRVLRSDTCELCAQIAQDSLRRVRSS